MKRARRTAVLAVLAAACLAAALISGVVSHGAPAASAAGPCDLGNKDGAIKHVIYLQFDNTHFTRHNQHVASHREHIPHLLNSLKGNGTLPTNHPPTLIS